MKKCKLCGETKELSEFYKSKDSKDWYRTYCKECWKNRWRLYYYFKQLNPVVEVDAPKPRMDFFERVRHLFI